MFDPSWKSAMQQIGHGTCDGCKFWSELIAGTIGGEVVKAMCLNPQSHQYQKMVCGGCGEYVPGRPIDDPTLGG